MSVRLMAQVWQLPLPSHLKLVLLAVADHANDEGWAYPGQQSLAAKVSLSERQTRANLKQLEELGYLQSHRRGRMRTNLYRVTPQPVDGPVDSPDFTQGERQPTSSSERQPTSSMRGSPLPPNHQRTIRENHQPASEAGYLWAERWAGVRQLPATEALIRTWARQVDSFMAAGGEPSEQLLQAALARGIEQPAGWPFAVEGQRSPWPRWLPDHLLKACQNPTAPVDPRWEREFSYGPHSTPPPERAVIIQLKADLMTEARAGGHVDEQLVQKGLQQALQRLKGAAHGID